MPNIKLSIIILSFNTKDLLVQTIDSISLKKDWEIIVVDNGSTDGSPEIIETNYPHFKLIRSAKNLGFAAGNNLGIKRARGEYIMLLNSDVKVIGDAIDELLAYLDRHPNVAIITPKVILPDGALDLACHRGMPTPWNAFTYFTKLETLFPNIKLFSGYHQTYQNFNQIHEVEATAATAIIVRQAAINQVGLLDERFFLYAEDLDWCKRMAEAGYQIIYYPKAQVLHYKSQSGKKKTAQNHDQKVIIKDSHHHFYDTMKQFYDKHYRQQYPKFIQKLVFTGIDLKQKLTRH